MERGAGPGSGYADAGLHQQAVLAQRLVECHQDPAGKVHRVGAPVGEQHRQTRHRRPGPVGRRRRPRPAAKPPPTSRRRSPTSWPSRSLTVLKSSRSISTRLPARSRSGRRRAGCGTGPVGQPGQAVMGGICCGRASCACVSRSSRALSRTRGTADGGQRGHQRGGDRQRPAGPPTGRRTRPRPAGYQPQRPRGMAAACCGGGRPRACSDARAIELRRRVWPGPESAASPPLGPARRRRCRSGRRSPRQPRR